MRRDCGEVQVRSIGGTEREQRGWREQATGTSTGIGRGLREQQQGFVFWPEEALMPPFQLLTWLELALLAQSLWGQEEAQVFTNTQPECHRSLIPSSLGLGKSSSTPSYGSESPCEPRVVMGLAQGNMTSEGQSQVESRSENL